MKVLKILGFVLLALVVVLVAAIGLFAYTFDPNDYKAEIVEQVRTETGRDLAIEGDIELSFFPWLGFTLGKTALSDDPDFSQQPFATVTAIEVKVRVWPLLQRRIEAGTIVVDGLTLNLIVAANGTGNWETLAQAAAKGETDRPSSADEPATDDAGTGVAGIAIGGLTLTNAAISYEDRQSGQSVVVRPLNLETGAVDLGQPVDIKGELSFEASQPPMAGTLQLASVVEADLDQQQYRVSDTRLDLSVRGDGLPEAGLESSLELAASVDLLKQLAKVEPLRVSLWNIALEASVEGRQIIDQPVLNGVLRVAEFSPRDLMDTLGAAAPETSDPEALSRAAFEADFQATPESAQFPKLALELDQTRLGGSASVMNFSQPAIEFDFAVDSIDLDRYLPPADTEGEAEATTGGDGGTGQSSERAEEAAELPLEALRALNVKGSVDIEQLKVSNLRASNAELEIGAENGMVKLDPLKLDLYQGRAQGAAALDATGSTPKIRSQIEANGVQAEPLLRDLTGEALISGRGAVRANITAAGATGDAITKTLNGTAGMLFKDGAVNGVNVARIIRVARARLKREPVPEENEPNQTDFTELSATAKITNGIVSNNDLSLKSPLVRIAGEGSADLPRETLDYRAKATVVGTLKGQGGKAVDDLKGVTVPVLISGSFANPDISPDMEAFAKQEARRLAEKHGDKATGKARKELEKRLGKEKGGQVGDQLDKALEKLFN